MRRIAQRLTAPVYEAVIMYQGTRFPFYGSRECQWTLVQYYRGTEPARGVSGLRLCHEPGAHSANFVFSNGSKPIF
jgi:hypothetical protein